MSRHGHDQPAARANEVDERGGGLGVVLDMLQDVQRGNGRGKRPTCLWSQADRGRAGPADRWRLLGRY